MVICDAFIRAQLGTGVTFLNFQIGFTVDMYA